MNFRITLFFLICAEASVISGASAQNNVSSDISSLISSVKSNQRDSGKLSSDSDSVRIDWGDDPYIYMRDDSISRKDNVFDVLSFLSEDVYGKDAITNDDALLIGSGKTVPDLIMPNDPNKKLSEKVFDYFLNTFASSDYYQSGHWEKVEDFSYLTRDIVLPDFDTSDFYRPVSGRITSLFGYRATFRRVHKGIDIALNVGDSVRAAFPGVVAKVGYDHFGYGHYVVVIHKNGIETRYAHLQRPVATPGEQVNAGDILGFGGDSGNSTGPHLHFEVRDNGLAVDPVFLFDFHGSHNLKRTKAKQ